MAGGRSVTLPVQLCGVPEMCTAVAVSSLELVGDPAVPGTCMGPCMQHPGGIPCILPLVMLIAMLLRCDDSSTRCMAVRWNALPE